MCGPEAAFFLIGYRTAASNEKTQSKHEATSDCLSQGFTSHLEHYSGFNCTQLHCNYILLILLFQQELSCLNFIVKSLNSEVS